MAEKKAVTDFYSSSVDMDRQAFLDERQIEYVFMGKRERSFQPPEIPESYVPIFSTPEVVIFKVAAPLN
jgi:uncharacterized membrane protein